MNIKSILTSSIPAAALLFSFNAHALTEIQAHKLVTPFYNFLSNPTDKSAEQSATKLFAKDWKTYYSNDQYKGLDETVKKISYIGKLVPDLKWEIKNLSVSGNVIVVRSEASGKPTDSFFGVPYKGGKFKIMAIDIHHVSPNGKITTSYHVEDWASAIKQLKSFIK